ncbi:MAG: SelT/SelW/SelH family protein [Proteobacteria bacterium]|nr:SelT/SelW/SelH family protein [Pseudomonadota bacterium]
MPKATSLVEKIKGQMEINEKLVPSGGGVFEVKVDGDLIFSKKKVGRFPDENEIIEVLKAR